MHPEVKSFFDPQTWTGTYLVWDPASGDAIVIDPVLDYDPAASHVSRTSVDEVAAFVKAKGLSLHLALDTHAHADHLSGSQALKAHFPDLRVAIGSGIRTVQATFKAVFNLGEEFATDGRQFDILLEDDSLRSAGTVEVRTLFTPGHTPACVSYLIGDALFTGDTLFMPDYGTGRCDFPGGNAATLYDSVIRRLYTLPDHTRVFVGHDYPPGGRAVALESTIEVQRRANIHLRADITREAFVQLRTVRDRTLSAPRLLLPSVQFNMRAGMAPPPESNGVSYLKIPLRG
jgi:glyoxylase-like metal-dependent hydrolase (beta-lactamase superfamily II)